jgi:hypothetical protein
MTENQIQAGSSVESLCKRCKTVTDHHVVAMLGDKIAKVECKVCRARHAYASPKAEPKVKTPAAPRAKSAAAASGAAAPAPKKASAAALKQAQAQTEQWEKLISPCSSPLAYSMERTFRTGDVLAHPVFGPGYVQKVMKPCTIEVLFKDAVRNLRCGKLA